MDQTPSIEETRKESIKNSLQKLSDFWITVQKHLQDIGIFRPCDIITGDGKYSLGVRKVGNTWQVCYKEINETSWKRIHDASSIVKLQLCSTAPQLVDVLHKTNIDLQSHLEEEEKHWENLLLQITLKQKDF